MGYIRTVTLVLALFMMGSLIQTTMAADGPAMDGTDVSGASTHEFLMVRVTTPESIEISVGDSVTWRNLQRPKFPIVLVSNDGLWDDRTIYYGKVFTYTFEEAGTYTFSVQDNPAMSGTVVVSEKKMQSVTDQFPVEESADDAVSAAAPVSMVREDTGAASMDQILDRSNEFLIVRIATPSVLEVYAGDTVTWRNLQRPKFPVVLVSDDGLWDDHTIYYGKIFSFTFDEPGTYTFSVRDKPGITGTIIVAKGKMATVEDTTAGESTAAPGPMAVMVDDSSEVYMEQDREMMKEHIRTMVHAYEVLMIRVATPESMEISVGDSVTWRNLQRPKFPIVLVSDEGLWDDHTIYYGKVFTYTFEEPGTYGFSVRDNAAMKGTIIVT